MSRPNGFGLTVRQLQIAMGIADDLSAKEIADRLGLSVKTVEFHKKNVYTKLGVRGPAGLTRWLIRYGYIQA